jgi:FMN-dependent NADH-azoreductase
MHVLEINASARQEGSISRHLVDDLVAALQDRYAGTRITRRDIAAGLPFISEDWVRANFRNILALSDELVSELEAANVVVIGAPIYNFSVPATLKAWIDMVARARKTFRYTETGVEGLLKGKKAFVVVPSGGVPVGSAMDFATPYLRHVLGFIGITDVEIIGAQGADRGNDAALDDARARIADLIHLPPQAA